MSFNQNRHSACWLWTGDGAFSGNVPYCTAGQSPVVATVASLCCVGLTHPHIWTLLTTEETKSQKRSSALWVHTVDSMKAELGLPACGRGASFSSLAQPSWPGSLTVMLADCCGTAPLCSQAKFFQSLINVHSIFGTTWCHTSFHKYYKHTQPHPVPQEPTSEAFCVTNTAVTL